METLRHFPAGSSWKFLKASEASEKGSSCLCWTMSWTFPLLEGVYQHSWGCQAPLILSRYGSGGAPTPEFQHELLPNPPPTSGRKDQGC